MVKLASDDATSRGTGVGMGAYYREIAFYQNLAERLGDSVPGCHLAVYDPGEGWFTLVLDDVAGAVQGDQIAGCSVEQARLALDALARIHAPVLGDLALGTADWLNQPNPLTQELADPALAGLPRALRATGSPTSTLRSWSASCRRSTAGTRTPGRRWGWCTATTAWTTCCSPTAPAPRSTGRR